MVCGIASGAAHDWQISATIFVVLYGLDFLVKHVFVALHTHEKLSLSSNRSTLQLCLSSNRLLLTPT
jgi:hypothetical protein